VHEDVVGAGGCVGGTTVFEVDETTEMLVPHRAEKHLGGPTEPFR
jgi:hypothetical protein